MTYEELKTHFSIQLNTQQEEAVKETEGKILLLAVPGSGKTTVLVTRLGYMVYCRKILPEQILTVTYTVAATEDMRKRYASIFGEEYAGRLEFRTINGISQKILQYFADQTGKKVYDVAGKETATMLKNAFYHVTGSFATENDIREITTAITYVKNMQLERTEIEKQKITENSQFAEIYGAYQAELRRQKQIDYDDQMVYALRILKSYPQVLSHFQDSYHYICVDEAQDTSKIQHAIIELLAEKSGNLFMVGDEDQSIYGFRAAYPEALIHFEDRHQNAKVLLMEKNYRSSAEIVQAADRLISKNQERHEKKMNAARKEAGSLLRIPVKNRKAQYTYLEKVAENCEKETAVLYRNHESALPLIDRLDRDGIPYRMKNSDMTFFSHPVVNDICDFLMFSLNPNDTEIFMRIYYKMGAGISKKLMESVVENTNLKYTLLEQTASTFGIPVYAKKQCLSLNTHFKNMKMESAGKAIFRILNYMGYQDYMDKHGMDTAKAEILRLLGEQEADIRSFLNRLKELQETVREGNGSPDCPFILSTIHSSKGLEYERVYLLDMTESVFEDSEEDRRLFYVGMTRAKSELCVFTFEDGTTVNFAKELFFKKSERQKRIEIAGQHQSLNKKETATPSETYKMPKLDQQSLEDYQKGTYILHKKYGLGLIVEVDGDVASIAFGPPEGLKKISLSVAVSSGAIRK